MLGLVHLWLGHALQLVSITYQIRKCHVTWLTDANRFMMGWLVPLVPWFLGMFYMCSNVRSKRIAGGLNFVFFFLYSCVQALLMLLPMIDKSRNYDFRMLGMSGS